ncbi:helix-turn-helix transcriptional regulator, UTRA domain-containing, GntR family [Syntrophotalea carbinolica DSM 2380]|uniref:Helix-turn-helix transcriptional regulator, UTRA domain-containing, GntR family n=1 Tax=Syntrophotalea carbinolica (strain DSM 2380 / NBRC 103641 / GraBd1) TaxID=338963 RepID=Q3A2C9_SYNC1|nr:GntR family transcriptional regulator [Syntrophotalea carbinolica]ABA89478.1 helix-turn-helix transcriptional regulator, UTRA domain-containing, GntR family [Syntrophotalea carbinolica DSM 2380]
MLNPDSPIPLYHQLAERLGEQIRNGELAPGQRIPSEPQLVAQYGIGRPTVRQALDSLVRQGLLCRRRGSGTYVSEPAREIDLFSLDGTAAAFHKKGLAAQTRIREAIRLQPIEDTPDNPFSGRTAYYFSRLTCLDNAPVLLEDLYLHPQMFAGIEDLDLAGRSLSGIAAEHFMLRPQGGKQSFRIGYPDAARARCLDVTTTTPLLQVERRLDFAAGRDGFFSRLFCRTDHIVFSQHMGASDHG